MESPTLAAPSESGIRTLIDELLEEQQQLTAVERFSQKHESATEPLQARYYRELIPLNRPGPEEQYGFEVDLEACSGCKACVSACHSLNGLDGSESWRDVGELVGGNNGATMQQTVTTACHHCADPACANGCPTLAYEKDLDTGIVRHLDDQCMGCRYCELKCPYEVPKYNDRLGIVRKCDMCHKRLAEGEAPACVQACPNEAIRIRVIPLEEIEARSGTEDHLLPGTVSSDYTQPSTRFQNLRSNAAPLPADADRLEPAYGHFPLAWMLGLTQVGAGIIAGTWLLGLLTGEAFSPGWVMRGTLISLAGLVGSVLHLGRPTQAWRAFLGWRRSWLSREILAFGPWSGAMIAFAAAVILDLPRWTALLTGGAATGLGILGVFCSVMVYADTRRPFWKLSDTTLRFFTTMIAAALVVTPLAWIAALVRIPVFILDGKIRRGKGRRLERTSRLFRGPLDRLVRSRFLLDAIAILLIGLGGSSMAIPGLGFLVLADLAGRALFFRAVDEPGMPGGVAA